jgi:hypothetical protein
MGIPMTALMFGSTMSYLLAAAATEELATTATRLAN